MTLIRTLVRQAWTLLSATPRMALKALDVLFRLVIAAMFIAGVIMLLSATAELYLMKETMWIATATAAFCSYVLGLYYVVIRPAACRSN